MLFYAWQCYAELCYAELSCAVLCYAIFFMCFAVFFYAMLCFDGQCKAILFPNRPCIKKFTETEMRRSTGRQLEAKIAPRLDNKSFKNVRQHRLLISYSV